VVNRVIDSLDVRLSRNRLPSVFLLEQLRAWRAYDDAWEPGTDPMFLELPGLGTFRVMPDRRPYELKLVNPELGDVRIWNPEKWASSVGSQTGQLYVSFRSAFLQFGGLEAAVEVLERLVDLLCGDSMTIGSAPVTCDEFTRISRVDLAADTQETRDMLWADLDRFTCRSRKRETFTTPYSESVEKLFKALSDGEKASPPPPDNKGGDSYAEKKHGPCATAAETVLRAFARETRALLAVDGEAHVSRVVSGGRVPQTVYFGRFGSALYARRYNKLLSLPGQRKLYMLDVWTAGGWDGVSPVWRTEFSLSGDFLCAVKVSSGDVWDLRDLAAFASELPAVWAYLTGDWLRHCNPSRDTNPSRWVSSPLWRAVASAWTAARPASRAPRPPRPDEGQLFAQVRGVAVSLAALRSSSRFAAVPDFETGEIHDPVSSLLDELAGFLGSDEGVAAVQARRRRLGTDELTDTALSALYRADRMLEGTGS